MEKTHNTEGLGAENISMFFSNSIANRKGFLPRPALFRAWTGGGGREAGSTQGDAIREIYGSFTRPLAPSDAGAAGAFSSITRANYLFQRAQGESMAEVEFKASRVVQTAEENRPVNIALPVILYLGEKS